MTSSTPSKAGDCIKGNDSGTGGTTINPIWEWKECKYSGKEAQEAEKQEDKWHHVTDRRRKIPGVEKTEGELSNCFHVLCMGSSEESLGTMESKDHSYTT